MGLTGSPLLVPTTAWLAAQGPGRHTQEHKYSHLAATGQCRPRPQLPFPSVFLLLIVTTQAQPAGRFQYIALHLWSLPLLESTGWSCWTQLLMFALSESRNSVEICDRVGFIQNANRSSALGSIVQPAATRTYCIMLRHGCIKDLKERVGNLYIKITRALPVRPYITILLASAS